MSKKTLATFDNPPPKDTPFCAYTHFQKMFVCKDWDTFEKVKTRLDKCDQFIGWHPLHIDDKSPFLGTPIPPKQITK